MRTTAAFLSLGAIDARNVARDSMLRWIAIFTPALGLLIRVAVPRVADTLHQQFGFDLVAYYPLLMSFLPLVAAGMIGTVVGFLLLDQRDDQTLTALLVTPLSLGDYLRYRLGGPMLLTSALGAVMVPLAGLSKTTALQVVVSALTAAPLAPIYALFLGTFAANKVQGFALAKAAGVVLVPCVASYFLTGPLQSAFGIVPHYWCAEGLLAVRRGSDCVGAGTRDHWARLAGGSTDAAREAFLACRQAVTCTPAVSAGS